MGTSLNINNSDKKGWLNESIWCHLKYKFYVYKRKYPLIFEDYLGLNLRYHLIVKSIGNNIVPMFWFQKQFEAKNRILEGESDLLIENYFEKNSLKVDDILEACSGHRAIHLAALFDDEELIDYLIKKDAHLMARDWNGYTALLKAASLGRVNICKKLVEAGVPPFHKDPWGVTPLDKAILYKQTEVIEYLQNLDKNTNKEKIDVWKKKEFQEKYKLTLWFMKQF
jgi:hypothetical protein